MSGPAVAGQGGGDLFGGLFGGNQKQVYPPLGPGWKYVDLNVPVAPPGYTVEKMSQIANNQSTPATGVTLGGNAGLVSGAGGGRGGFTYGVHTDQGRLERAVQTRYDAMRAKELMGLAPPGSAAAFKAQYSGVGVSGVPAAPAAPAVPWYNRPPYVNTPDATTAVATPDATSQPPSPYATPLTPLGTTGGYRGGYTTPPGTLERAREKAARDAMAAQRDLQARLELQGVPPEKAAEMAKTMTPAAAKAALSASGVKGLSGTAPAAPVPSAMPSIAQPAPQTSYTNNPPPAPTSPQAPPAPQPQTRGIDTQTQATLPPQALPNAPLQPQPPGPGSDSSGTWDSIKNFFRLQKLQEFMQNITSPQGPALDPNTATIKDQTYYPLPDDTNNP